MRVNLIKVRIIDQDEDWDKGILNMLLGLDWLEQIYWHNGFFKDLVSDFRDTLDKLVMKHEKYGFCLKTGFHERI